MLNNHSQKIRTLLEEGSALHQSGNLQEAKIAYENLLQINPKQFEAIHLLGTLHAQMGQLSMAIELLNKAILINPKQYDTYANLGNAYLESNQFENAIKNYKKAIKLKPHHPKDHCNLGIALHKLKKYKEAIGSFEKAIAIKPDFANAYLNRGNAQIEVGEIESGVESYEKALAISPQNAMAYQNLGLASIRLKKYEKAIAIFDQALQVKPDFPDALMNKGIALIELGKLDMALQCFQAAVEIDPKAPQTHYNMGIAQTSLGNLDSAILSFDKAIEIRSDFADAYSGRAVAQIFQGDFEAAVESYKSAIEINPNNSAFYLNLGNALAELRRFEECLASYDKAIELKIDYAEAYGNRGHILLTYLNDPTGALVFFEVALGLRPDFTEALINQGQAYIQLDKIEKSINSFLRALEINPNAPFVIGKCLHHKMKICDWDNLSEGISICESLFYNGVPAAVPFEALVLFDNAEVHYISAKLAHDAKLKNVKSLGDFPQKEKKQKIRIGYFSADLYYHPVSIWLAEQLENHDKSKFELFAFCMNSVIDPMRDRLENAFDHWIEIGNMSDLNVTQLSRDLGIDIAIDLNGHTANSRPGIFAARAAPVQINHIGYPGTMAVDYIDYFISDQYYLTDTIKKHFKEKIAFVPCLYTYDRQRQVSEEALNRGQFGLPENAIVLTCQNSHQKIMPEVFDIWMEILKAVPHSVLWLADQHPLGKNNLLKEAKARGIDSARLIFSKREFVAKDQENKRISRYLASYKMADLFLDTWPYNAGTTAVDALWAGLPVLTKAGNSTGSRMAASALHAIEMPELITNTVEEYRDLAIELASDRKKLEALKVKLQENRVTSALFDPVGNTRHIEAAFTKMHERYLADLPPDNFYIGPSSH